MITFSSCFYILKSKFDVSKYIYWMNNFISIVNHFYLIIYTDENSVQYINTKNPKIKIVIKPLEQFYNYHYKSFWIENHKKNHYLNEKICWELSMLWCEKIWFVKETAQQNYFKTDLYGWCDIGYFRNGPTDLNTFYLQNWCKNISLDTSKIHYACINNDTKHMNELIKSINNKNHGVPKVPIVPNKPSIGGGFFIIHKNKINTWCHLFDQKLKAYIKFQYLVKDDQILLADCIYTSSEHFQLHYENNKYDNWFMFQRILN